MHVSNPSLTQDSGVKYGNKYQGKLFCTIYQNNFGCFSFFLLHINFETCLSISTKRLSWDFYWNYTDTEILVFLRKYIYKIQID